VLTVGLDAVLVENDLLAGYLGCPAAGCGAALGPWGWARERLVRGLGRVHPRRARCRGCQVTQVLLPASVLLRRADTVTVIGAALLAKASGLGHRPIARDLGVAESTVRDWLRRIVTVADRVLAVLASVAAGLGTAFTAPAVTAGTAGLVGMVVELLGVLAASVARELGGSCSPWRLAAVVTAGRLLAPAGPDLPVGGASGRNTSSLWAAAR
jgi:hypothetical protein